MCGTIYKRRIEIQNRWNFEEAAITIDKDKYKLNCDKVSYSEYQISKDGISPDERPTKKIEEMPTQRN